MSYLCLLAKQSGACAICKRVQTKTLHVDHCHATGQIRGLLCFRCNYGLSFFSDDHERLSRAGAYIRAAEHRSQG